MRSYTRQVVFHNQAYFYLCYFIYVFITIQSSYSTWRKRISFKWRSTSSVTMYGNRIRNMFILVFERCALIYTRAWRTNCFDDDDKKWWRMKEWCGMIFVWNQRSMKSWCSWLTYSFRSLCMLSSTVPCNYSTIQWVDSFVHRWSTGRHVGESSISRSNGFSLLNAVCDSLASSTSWK